MNQKTKKLRLPAWEKEFRRRFIDDDGLMHNKYAGDEIVKYFEEVIYDTYWKARAEGYKEALQSKEIIDLIQAGTKLGKTVKEILEENNI